MTKTTRRCFLMKKRELSKQISLGKEKRRNSRRTFSTLHYISINTNKFYDQKRTLMIEELIFLRELVQHNPFVIAFQR